MAKEKVQIEVKEVYQFPTYSNEELRKTWDYCEKFRVTKTIEFLGKPLEISYIDFNAYLIEKEALSPEGAVYVENYHYEKNKAGDMYAVITYPTVFAVLQDKVDKMKDYKKRVDFVTKQLFDLDKMAVQVANDLKDF